MFNDFIHTEHGKKINKLAPELHVFTEAYYYYIESLCERIMRIIKFDNCPETMPSKEIMFRLIMDGKAFVTDKADGNIRVFFGTPSKQDKFYYDEFTKATLTAPMWSKTLDKKDYVELDLNSLKKNLFHLVHRYALLIGHTEVTLVNSLINARDTSGVPIAQTDKDKLAINKYYTDLSNGILGGVQDITFTGIDFRGLSKSNVMSITDLMSVRKELLYSFYEDLGVKTQNGKRGNLTDDEVHASDGLYMVNLKDIEDCLTKGCNDINKKYGTNISVHISEEIDLSNDSEVINDEDSTREEF